jgi:hypothetical protein
MSAAAALPRTGTRPWVHYVNDDFFDRPDLDPTLEHLALRFERLAREKPWFLTSNDELREQLGCSKNTLAALLKRGEQRGWFRRVLIPGRHRQATGRLGIVLYVRPTSRPVATDETFDQVVAQMMAEIRRGKTRPRTLPFPPSAFQGRGASVPKNWVPSVPKNWVPPISKEKDTGKETQKTTTTLDSSAPAPISIHASSESSSLASLPQEPETQPDPSPVVQPIEIVPAPKIPAAKASTQPAIKAGAPAVSPPSPAIRGERVALARPPAPVPSSPAAAHPHVETIEVTTTVSPQILKRPAEGIDQALLLALVARVVRLSAGFKLGPHWTSEQTRQAILGLVRGFGCPLWWISNALDQAEHRPRAKPGNKPVQSWGFIRQIVSNWSRGDGTPGSPPVAKPASPPGPPCPVAVSGDRTPSRSPPRSLVGATEPELCELSAGELRERIAVMEAALESLSSSPRLLLGEQLRTKLSQAQSLLSGREQERSGA